MPPRTPATRIVVQTRLVQFPYRVKANRVFRLDEAGKRKEREIDDPGGTGQQIVRELTACPTCARNR